MSRPADICPCVDLERLEERVLEAIREMRIELRHETRELSARLDTIERRLFVGVNGQRSLLEEQSEQRARLESVAEIARVTADDTRGAHRRLDRLAGGRSEAPRRGRSPLAVLAAIVTALATIIGAVWGALQQWPERHPDSTRLATPARGAQAEPRSEQERGGP